MNNKISFSDRMKKYENVSQYELMRKTPVIIRIDGKKFSNYTKNFEMFDWRVEESFLSVASYLMASVQNSVLIYCQSDEISIFLRDYTNMLSEPYLDNNISKLCSISASMATMVFNRHISSLTDNTKFDSALFDARAFNLPKEEVINYFIWRQSDCIRNSITKIASTLFSEKELNGKSTEERKALIFEKNEQLFNAIESRFKLGTIFFKKDGSIYKNDNLLFKDNRNIVEELVYIKKEENN